MRSPSPLWYPCTQMQQLEQQPPIEVVRGQGAYLYTTSGQPILDAISSWWVNLHGHSHPTINAAIIDQLGQLEHTLLAGLTHPPIEQLAQRLMTFMPTPLSHVFFADSGSAAIEVALKMSLQYWHQTGQPQRQTFISFENGYHGETLGSLAVTDIPLFSKQYHPILIRHLRAPSPDLSQKLVHQTDDEFIQHRLQAMQSLLEQHQSQVCAVIVEPLVQGAAGMKMYPARYLTALRQLCDHYQVHLIHDEIAVGFGRTGTMFAFEQAQITPDFVCLSKGLTAGYLPMSAVVTTRTIYQAFYHPDISMGFLHSHSFTGNPLAARAALASLDVFADEHVLQTNQAKIATLSQALKTLHGHPHIGAIRQTGLIAAFDLTQSNGQPYPSHEGRGRLISQYALKHGVLLRPIGAHVYIIPPYCITSAEIEQLIDTARQAIEWAVQQPALHTSMVNMA
ncbi:MAG: adenosylmethionine--8-amino-7-oxononanoate transaminase [Pseudomonadota bacterium]|nr:adenosylmethionine--8-amino-7-oxononanoate transaminase [Pseudomonadota bacterium]